MNTDLNKNKYTRIYIMEYITVYKSNTPKIRIGSDNDGGYVIEDTHTYDILISCGIGNNIDFENVFTNKYNISCIAFDGTIENINVTNDKITFYKKNIGIYNTEYTTNLHFEIEPYHDIFLKMDIETFEYRWLHTLSYIQLNKFKQIVIEFHFPFTSYPFSHLDIDIPISEKMSVFKKLHETHVLVHFHANNCCGTTIYDNTSVPNVFECTFVRKDICKYYKPNTDNIPSILDSPCVTYHSDISLSWPPFQFT
jgi:hypothetical protein